jgi:hypothetical protein
MTPNTSQDGLIAVPAKNWFLAVISRWQRCPGASGPPDLSV